MPAGWVGAAIGAVAAIGGAAISSDASRKASNTQADATRDATAIGDKQFQQTREDMADWRNQGKIALSQLGAGTAPGGEFNRNFTLADFVKDPGYDFRFNEGQQGVEAGASARGGILSGRALKEIVRYGQGFGSNEYQNSYNRYNNDLTTRFNRLSSLAGTGQTATRDVAQFGANNANSAEQNLMMGANARASGYVGEANAIGGGLSSLVNQYQMRELLKKFGPNTGTAPAPAPYYAGASGDELDQMYGYGGP